MTRVPAPGALVLVREDYAREGKVVRVVDSKTIEVQFAPGLKRVVRIDWCQNLSAMWTYVQ